MSRAIDLNADMGEYVNAERRANEAALMPLVSSCSIACGGHAGTEATMRATARLAKQHGVSIGAHPSYPDRKGFGRRSLDFEPADLSRTIKQQINTLKNILDTENITLRHIKPHGALYNDAAKDRALASIIVDAAGEVSKEITIIGPPGSALEKAAEKTGARFAAEGFIDRLYQKNGTLTPRSEPGAVIRSIQTRARQALSIAQHKPTIAADGELILSVKTLCIHSDSPAAVFTAMIARAALENDGFTIRALS